MKLELGTFSVRDVVFSDKTNLRDGTLSVNRRELQDLVAQDPSFEDVEIDIARPGQESRIVHAIDIVEPRFKVSGGTIFPGILGPPHTGGQGRTHRLFGVAVVETSEPVADEPTHWREAIIDMSGRGAQYSPFAKTVNLVLTLKPKPYLTARSPASGTASTGGSQGTHASGAFNAAVRLAGLKASAYLASITEEMKPDRLDTYELGPVDASLPKVAFAHRLFHSTLYGESTLGHLATLIHPNESMDGAVVNVYNSPASKRDFTYFELNNPVVSELYNRHGKDLNFVGVILYNSALTKPVDQERMASYAANLAELLAAQGVLLPGGSQAYNGAVVMLLCQRLERRGIKTVIISPEMSASPGDEGLTHYVSEAVAMVSAGNYEEKISLPAVKKLIGGDKLLETDIDAAGALNVPVRYLCGATNHSGFGRLVCQQY